MRLGSVSKLFAPPAAILYLWLILAAPLLHGHTLNTPSCGVGSAVVSAAECGKPACPACAAAQVDAASLVPPPLHARPLPLATFLPRDRCSTPSPSVDRPSSRAPPVCS